MYTYNKEDVIIDLNIPISQQIMLTKAIGRYSDLIQEKVNEVLKDFQVTDESLDKISIIFNWIDLNKEYQSFETSAGNCVVLILISWMKDNFPGNMAVKLRFRLENMKLTLI